MFKHNMFKHTIKTNEFTFMKENEDTYKISVEIDDIKYEGKSFLKPIKGIDKVRELLEYVGEKCSIKKADDRIFLNIPIPFIDNLITVDLHKEKIDELGLLKRSYEKSKIIINELNIRVQILESDMDFEHQRTKNFEKEIDILVNDRNESNSIIGKKYYCHFVKDGLGKRIESNHPLIVQQIKSSSLFIGQHDVNILIRVFASLNYAVTNIAASNEDNLTIEFAKSYRTIYKIFRVPSGMAHYMYYKNNLENRKDYWFPTNLICIVY